MDSWKWRWNKKFWIQKYWKKISSQLCLLLYILLQCLKMLNRRQSKMLRFHFTFYLEGIENFDDTSICQFDISQVYRQNRNCFHDQPTRKSSIIFFLFFSFLFDYFQTVSSNIFSTRKHRTRTALSRIFFVDGEYGFTMG